MIYVGIDCASEKHDYFMRHSSSKAYSKHSLTVPNSESGYKKLHEDISAFSGAMKDTEIRIGLESTGFFHKNILNFLVGKGYSVMLINPKLVNLYKKSKRVHCPKNDNLDSKAISEFVETGEFNPYTLKSYHIEALKSLSRERFQLISEIRNVKQSVYRLITVMFPEYLGLFSNVYQGSAIAILKAYPGALQISRARPESIASHLHGRCRTDAVTIRETARKSVGDRSEYLSFELSRNIRKLDSMNRDLDEYDAMIAYHVDTMGTQIMTIPGISYVNAGLILGEIGDITRFRGPDQLVSYSGTDIEVYESGKFKSTNRSISKKGTRYLRYALFQAAKAIWRYDPVFGAYYQKKLGEGKHFLVIMGHIEKKLLRVIYSVLKNGRPYTPQA